MTRLRLSASAANTKGTRIGRLLTAAAMTTAMSLAVAGAASAAAVVPGFTNLGTVPACDDCFTAAINPSMSLNFFGTTYTQLFVSNNGYITFQSGQGTFTPTGLGANYSGQPIIAAFFADVDTRGAGAVNYGTGTYAGRNAFGVTYDNVGYYEAHGNKLNDFQILLVDRGDVTAGDFDIYLNYDQIQWETGDFNGGSNGLGGTSASAGFNAGAGNAPGTFFEFNGSLAPGALIDGGPNSLVAGTNNNLPGQYLFQVRNGGVIVPPIDGAIPEPATWAMMILGIGGIGALIRRRNAVQAATA